MLARCATSVRRARRPTGSTCTNSWPREFATKLAARMVGSTVGKGTKKGVDVGPPHHGKARDGDARTRRGRRRGGCAGRCRWPDPVGQGQFLSSDGPGRRAIDGAGLREEIFGPVAPITTFQDRGEVVSAANATEYGLVAYVFTRDNARSDPRVRGARLRHGRDQPGHRPQPGGSLRWRRPEPASDARVGSKGSRVSRDRVRRHRPVTASDPRRCSRRPRLFPPSTVRDWRS